MQYNHSAPKWLLWFLKRTIKCTLILKKRTHLESLFVFVNPADEISQRLSFNLLFVEDFQKE